MSDWYTLDNDRNVIGPFEISKAVSLPHDKRIVAKTKVYDGCNVSTVFLQVDHSWNRGPNDPPIVFETMVFGGPFDQEQERYATWAEAESGHARMVEKCQPIMTEDAP